MTTPDFLVVGHITKDITPQGYTIGGTATYAAATARRLGLRVAIVTSVAPDIDLSPLPADVQVHRLPSAVSTTFENIYTHTGRIQYLRAVALPLDCSSVPAAWRSTPITLLGPLAQEVDPGIVDCFPGALLGVTPQGWMRAWDAAGRVSYTPWTSAPRVLGRANALVISEEDVQRDEATIRDLARQAAILVVTRGPGGADLFEGGEPTRFPAYSAWEVDPTGAGDVFATAFLARLKETGQPRLAIPFANAAASFSIEGRGIEAAPTRSQVLQRMEQGKLILS